MPEVRRVSVKVCYCYGQNLGLLALRSWGYGIFILSCELCGGFLCGECLFSPLLPLWGLDGCLWFVYRVSSGCFSAVLLDGGVFSVLKPSLLV